MHILLTDALTCPRCGPKFGLIVLADRLDDRRVVEGRLGCANCRDEYPVQGGVADLRLPQEADSASVDASAWPEERAFRLAALLGVGDRPGTVLMLGLPAAATAAVARLLPAAQVVAASAEEEPAGSGAVSRMRVGGALPFRDRSLRAVAMSGEFAPGLVEEGVRVLAPGGNLVLDPAPPTVAGMLTGRGIEVLLEQEGVVVASPPLPG